MKQQQTRCTALWRWALALAALTVATHAAPRVEDLSWGPIRVRLTLDPAGVQLDRDTLLTLEITAPSEIDISLPELHDRLEGFTLAGLFDEEPVVADGATTRRLRARLTPQLTDRYRVAPLPIVYTDTGRSPPESGWFPTRAVTIDREPLAPPRPVDRVGIVLEPDWIYPSFRTVALSLILFLVVLAGAAALFRFARRLQVRRRLAGLSPRERALAELDQLLASGLPASNRTKDFYVALTGIVRRYIERRHGIRAAEQTTEEFLAAAAGDTRFARPVLASLRQFLEAADLVKFAAVRPGAATIERAVETARRYIESDTRGPEDGHA
jgi:hypothetical protein